MRSQVYPKTAFKASAQGIKKAAMSEAVRTLAKNLKDVAISSAADMAASAITGDDPTIVLQQGVESAKSEIAGALKRKANQHRSVNTKKRKVEAEKTKVKNSSKSRKKKTPYNLFEQN